MNLVYTGEGVPAALFEKMTFNLSPEEWSASQRVRISSRADSLCKVLRGERSVSGVWCKGPAGVGDDGGKTSPNESRKCCLEPLAVGLCALC